MRQKCGGAVPGCIYDGRGFSALQRPGDGGKAEVPEGASFRQRGYETLCYQYLEAGGADGEYMPRYQCADRGGAGRSGGVDQREQT